jgi:hypothetical protein
VLAENPSFSLPWTCDTVALGIADGTHIIYPRILDSSTTSIFERMTQAQAIIVANHGFNNGTQTIPVAATTQNRGVSPRPDFITYTAGNPYPARTPRPIAYTFIAGSNNPALRTDPTLWYGESWCGPRNSEYHTSPELVTTPSGGVYAYYIDPLQANTTFNSYLGVVFQNSFDGTSMNALVSPFTTYVEDPAGGGKWWGAEINGRVFNITHDGTVTTVIGVVRDKTKLTYDPSFPGLTETDFDVGGKRISRGNLIISLRMCRQGWIPGPFFRLNSKQEDRSSQRTGNCRFMKRA